MSDQFYKENIVPKKGMLFRLALRMLNDRPDAEDATSEVLIKLWLKRDQLSLYDNIDRLLFTTIKNQCIDMLRSRKHFMSLESNLESFVVENQSAGSTHESKIMHMKRIIDKLPEKQKMIIHFRMMEGYSMQQIADIMNEKVNTVEVNISRARKKIREAYEKDIIQKG